MPHFQFKSKMQDSMRSQRTLLVPLFKLVEKVIRVKMEVDDPQDTCDTEFFGKDHDKACFLGGSMNPPHNVQVLQSPPAFTLTSKNQLDISDLGLDQDTLDTIQKMARAVFHKNKVK